MSKGEKQMKLSVNPEIQYALQKERRKQKKTRRCTGNFAKLWESILFIFSFYFSRLTPIFNF